VVIDHEQLQEPYLSADTAPFDLVSSSVIIVIALIRLELGKRSLLHDVSKQSGWVKPCFDPLSALRIFGFWPVKY